MRTDEWGGIPRDFLIINATFFSNTKTRRTRRKYPTFMFLIFFMVQTYFVKHEANEEHESSPGENSPPFSALYHFRNSTSMDRIYRIKILSHPVYLDY
jgi:hypothetical protein